MKLHTLHIKLSTVLCTLLLVPLKVFAADSGIGLSLTALDHYVREPDSNYSYEIISTINEDGYKTFIVEMTSQKWLTKAEVNFPIWEHYMVIVVPDVVESDIGFLTITGGSKSNNVPTSPLPTVV